MAEKSDHNPQGDDDVEAGWKKNKEYNKRRKQQEQEEAARQKEQKERRQKKQTEGGYEVDDSGTTVSGPNKDQH